MNEKMLEGLDDKQYELIDKMLQFNPNKRVSAEELLKNPIFDSVRIPNLENNKGNEIKLSIDEEGVLDYDNEDASEKQM